MKRAASVMLAFVLLLAAAPFIPGQTAEAKTVSSAKADRVFIYAEDEEGKDVLMGVYPLSEIKKLSHGQENGENYYYSSTDNYPTTQYCEARGVTVPELVEYVSGRSSVAGASDFSFNSGDMMYLMATDSYGNYTRNWTYDQLYELNRYYFEGLYDKEKGWKTGWEIAGEDNSKFGIDIESYNEQYKEKDPYYEDKKAAFDGGVEMPVLLAVDSFSGRTTTESLNASTEPGIAAQVEANGGTVAGCLGNMLTEDTALRLCIPMTEADLMSAHRTAYDNFKWVYNLKFRSAGTDIHSEGTVEAPAASFSQSDDTLYINISCATEGADIYYSFDGAAQIPYTGTVEYDTKGADLTNNPVTIYMTAVKEGYDDAGVVTAKYPSSGVSFKTLYSGMIGADVVFEAEDSVSAKEWNDWTSSILGITCRMPGGDSYAALDRTLYAIDNNARTVTFDKSIFDSAGSYNFTVMAKGYANKRLSLSMKKGAPELSDVKGLIGKDIVISFDDTSYQNSLYLYITPEEGTRTLISSACVDRKTEGQVTLKKEWFDQISCPAKEPGSYQLELVNNSFSPSSQTITLTLAEASAFEDVNPFAWYAEPVAFAFKHGLFSGIDETHFAPDSNMTRAMFATVLYRFAGKPSISGSNTFTDVKAGQWYTDPVIWANEKGYVTGYGDGLFGTDDPITREQIATILYRYSKNTGADVSVGGEVDLSGFEDRDRISSYASDAIEWAVDRGIINGMSSTELNPRGLATRAQVAKMFMKFSEINDENEEQEVNGQ